MWLQEPRGGFWSKDVASEAKNVAAGAKKWLQEKKKSGCRSHDDAAGARCGCRSKEIVMLWG